MKTPQEIYDEFGPDLQTEATLKLIRFVQADARESALREAAKEAKESCCASENQCGDECRDGCEWILKLIPKE